MEFITNAVLIDTSAIIALNDSKDQNHSSAIDFFKARVNDVQWIVINYTKYEAYTYARYHYNFEKAINIYGDLSNNLIYQLRFKEDDEKETLRLLNKYKDEKLSFHDALCASIMIRSGLFRVFTFDKHFLVFGFEVFPFYKGIF